MHSTQFSLLTHTDVLAITASLALAAIFPPSAHAQKSQLQAGELIVTGQTLQSPNRKFYAVQQADGNLCVYSGTPDRATGNLWCHHKLAAGGQFVTVLQQDGNLCTYSGTPAGYSKLSWCSQSQAPGGRYVLAMQDDGNLCVYSGTPTQLARTLWCHNTHVLRSQR